MKRKRFYKNQLKTQANDIYFPYQTKNSLSPIQMGLTSNQRNIISTDKDSPLIMNNFENGIKRICDEKGMTKLNTTNSLSMNNDEIETINEVLGMEERNGKIFYKVNFIGHSPDYTAWVCEEDLLTE